MAFPTSNNKLDLARALARSMERARQVKAFFTEAIAQMAAGPVSASLIIEVGEQSVEVRNFLTDQKQLPGMGQYAKDQLNDQGLDIVAEANALIGALDDLAVYLDDNWPPATGATPIADMDREGLRFNKSDGINYEMWSSGKSATLRAMMQAVVDTID